MATGPHTLTIGAVSAPPGTTTSGTWEITPRTGDSGTTVPFTIINGASAGSALLLVAGVHGFEYAPIVALQRLRRSIDPASLRGTVLMVHVANMPSFMGRTIYYSPVDGCNLNRVFPGDPEGTISQRIADAITRQFIERATHVVDLHGGDGNESLRPYSYWITTGDRHVVEGSRSLALAFGLDHIVVDGDRPTEAGASVYLSNTAITRGKPAITTETGCLGRADAADIALIEHGVAGVLKHLRMRDIGPAPLTTPAWLTRNLVLRAGATGLFYPAVECGQTVVKGARVGHITDVLGATLEEVTAPFGGEILYVVATPPITAGEPLAMIGARLSGA